MCHDKLEINIISWELLDDHFSDIKYLSRQLCVVLSRNSVYSLHKELGQSAQVIIPTYLACHDDFFFFSPLCHRNEIPS